MFDGKQAVHVRIGYLLKAAIRPANNDLGYRNSLADAEMEAVVLTRQVAASGMQLAFDEQTIDSVRSRVGIQLSNNFNTSFGSIRPMFSAEWFHEFEDKPRAIRAKYALEDALAEEGVADFSTGFGDCVSCFDLVSEAPETDYFVVGLGLAATTQRGFQSFLMLEGLLGHSYLSAYAVTVGLRGQF